MNSREKELIAIGASVTANCMPCLKFHTEKAKTAGASEADISESIKIGRMVRKGAAGIWDDEIAEIIPDSANS